MGGNGRSATGDKSRWMPWITLQGIQQKQSPGFFHVFCDWWRQCVREARGHLRGHQGLLLFGTAARLEEPRINNHLSKPALVDDATAHLLPEAGERPFALFKTFRQRKSALYVCPQLKAVQREKQLTFSSTSGPGKRRWRESGVFAWTRCQSRRPTGCCNWATALEIHWMLCCGHRSLLGKQK